MTDEAWNAGFVKALGVVLVGATGEVDNKGKPIVGDSLMLLLNAHWEPIEFHFPKLIGIVTDFERLFDTAQPQQPAVADQPQPPLCPARPNHCSFPLDAASAAVESGRPAGG